MTPVPPSVETLTDLIVARAGAQPLALAYRFLEFGSGAAEVTEWTYADVDARARAIAAMLQERHAVGERALMLYAPGLDFIASFIGCLYAGVVAVPVYPPNAVRPERAAPRLRAIAADCRPRFVLTTRNFFASREAISGAFPELTTPEWLCTDLDDLSIGAQWRRPDLRGGDLAFLQYTSGSTGEPKGVMNRHDNLLHNQRAIAHCFRTDSAMHVVGWLPLFHDMGLIGNVLHPFYLGASCTLTSPAAFLRRPLQWLAAITRYRATVSGGPNFAYDLCVNKIKPAEREQLDLSSWVVAYNGSEPVRRDTLERFAAAFAPCGFRREAFLPCYGLAEATLFVSGVRRGDIIVREVDDQALGLGLATPAAEGGRSRSFVSAGGPSPDHDVLIVDPVTRVPSPPNTVGEIWFRGPSVAAGYWNAEEVSARIFRAHAVGEEGEFLRTGDLGFLADGEVYVTGRIKDVIILRGRNLYPQDVEATVDRAHPAIRSGGVAAFSIDTGGEERLAIVAEVDARGESENRQPILDAIRAAVAEEHDASAYAIVLIPPNRIPKTSSGKLQRANCREMWKNGLLPVLASATADATTADATTADARAWRAELEDAAADARPALLGELVAAELASALHVAPESIASGASLASLGVDSLMITELQARVEEALGIALPDTLSIWDAQTPRGFAELLERAWRDRDAHPIQPGPRESEAPASSGQRRLCLLEQLAESTAVYNIHFGVRIEGELRVDVFRRAFDELSRRHATLRTVMGERDGIPYQRILDESGIALAFTAAREEEIESRAHALAARPFDLQTGPLTRAELVRLSDREHVLLLAQHHTITDGWSLERLVADLAQVYEAFLAGRAPAAPPRLSFADFARWENENAAHDANGREFWARTLQDVPRLDLPSDLPATARRSYRGGRVRFAIDNDLAARLRELAREEDCTPFVALLAAYALLLHRHSGQDDLAIGSVVANRRPEVRDTLGFFTNTIVLRCDLADAPSFRELLRRLRGVVVEAMRHASVPFAEIVKAAGRARDGQTNPVFDAAFVLENGLRRQLDGGGLRWSAMSWTPDGAVDGTAKFDLSLAMQETPDGFDGAFEYSSDRFVAASVRRMVGVFEQILAEVAAYPDRSTATLDLLPPEEHALLAALNETEAEIPRDRCFIELFEEQVARTPDAIAVTDAQRRLTYRELHAEAVSVAHALRARGVGPDVLVALLMPRGVDLLVSILGVFKAGAAYVPIDPDYPPRRREQILEQSGATVLLTEPIHAKPDAAKPLLTAQPRNLAYVIFTSGSTGLPKGAMVEQLGMLNHLYAKVRDLDLRANDAIAQTASQCFDISVWQFLAGLLVGARIDVIDTETATDAPRLFEVTRESGITILEVVPSLLRSALEQLQDSSFDTGALRFLLVTGEALPPELARRWIERHPAVPIVNAYGPTECSDDVTHYFIRDTHAVDGAITPIGRAILNTRLHILDHAMQPVPIGVAGELYVGGICVGRGYLDDPMRTAAVFVPDPFRGDGSRLYRTGDVVRRLADGDIVFLGRTDHQVKIRGFRIELGEVEAVLGDLPSIAAAVVVARDRRLVAYVQPRHEVTSAELRHALRERLPDYMVPSLFVQLAEMPVNANGKIDRRALPEPEFESASSAPRTPAEELIAQIWSDVLGLRGVGADDDFFEIGGHSLLATQAMSRIRATFGVELPLRTLFEWPTVSGMARQVAAARGAGAASLPPIVRAGDRANVPLSSAQQRLAFLEQLMPGLPTYNVPGAVRIVGPLDADALERALAEIVRRHEVLRTRFVAGTQVIDEDPRFALRRVATTDDALPRLMREEAVRPFDLEHGPLIRATLFPLAPEEHVLLLTMHHIVSDGWSLGVLVREASALYAAFVDGRESPLPELPIQYLDYTAWQHAWMESSALDAQLAYWKARLDGVPAALEIPTDRPRGTMQSWRGAQHTVRIERRLIEPLRALTRRNGATLYMGLLAAFQALLARYSGQDDIAVGSPIAGRTRGETEALIGFFVNTLVMRADLSGAPHFHELLRRTREATLGAYANQDVPFEKLVEMLSPERDLSRTALFQAMFILQNAPMPRLELGQARLEPIAVETGTAKFDLTLSLEEQDGGVEGFLEYNSDLFDASTAARMIGHYERLLEAAVAEPERPLALLPLLTPAEMDQQFMAWNSTSGVYPEACLHDLFEDQAARTPDAAALFFGEETVTYDALNRRANRIANALRARGQGEGTFVGIAMPRSPGCIAAILGILKAGAAYVPLDPAYPMERLRLMSEAARLDVVLVDGHPALDFDADLLDIHGSWTAHGSEENPPRAGHPDGAAYVVFTSGSTGTPNGVVGLHRGAVNRAAWMWREMPFEPGERSAMKTSTNFVDSIWEIFGPLLAGVPSVILSADELRDTEALIAALAAGRATRIVVVPSLLRAMLETAPDLDRRLPLLRWWTSSGEALSAELARTFRERMPGRVLLNLYGSSEAAGDSTWIVADDSKQVIPIGRPIANTRVHILDRAMQPVPAGFPGEIYIGGDGLARGYLFNPELTAQRFVPHPFVGGDRLYRTLDIGRYRTDGAIEYVGRADRQVKVRGMRVDLGEIEATIGRHPRVRMAAVALHRERIVAYVVPHDAAEIADLRAFVAESLPEHMVPSVFMTLAGLPLTPNGKIDRRALPEPVAARSAEETRTLTPAEELIAQIWSDLLGIEGVAAGDDFFRIGGHSLLATRVMSRIREAFGVELPLRTLFEAPTLASLARRIEHARGAGAIALPPIARADRDGALPLSFAQQRLWFLEQLTPGQATYNIAGAVRIEGPLDAVALERAIEELVRRHESLRTRFVTERGEVRQEIDDDGEVTLRRIAAPDWERIVRDEVEQPFDLAAGPLLRCTLIATADDEHVLAMTMHHIISDGWSLGVLVREISALYETYAAGRLVSSLPPLPIQYADYSVWQREWLQGERLEAELAYWKNALAGAPPALELPVDRPRGATLSQRGAQHSLVLGRELVDALRTLVRGEGATLYMGLLAAFHALLARYSGQDDVSVGSPIAGRTRGETEGLIGLFVNTLVMRADLSGLPDFRELLHRVRETTLGAFAHQQLPFEKLVEALSPARDLNRAPLAQVMFVLQNAPRQSPKLGEARLTPIELPSTTAKFELTLSLEESADGALHGFLEYNTDLFDADTIARMAAHYERLLHAIVARPEQPVALLPMLSDAERAEQLVTWNDTAAAYPIACLHELFERQVPLRPDAIALIAEERAVTYGELDAEANRLAHALLRRGVKRGVTVGVRMERSIELITALLAISKAGAAYVPLDPEYPEARIAFMIADARASLVLTPETWPSTAGESASKPETGVTPDDLVYILHTSGSTGVPKGAMLSHRGVANCLFWMQERYRLDASDRFLFKTSLNFDPSVWEIFWPLMTGGAVVIARPGAQADAAYLAETIERERVTTLYFVPPMLTVFLESRAAGHMRSLRRVICGGEKLPLETMRRFFTLFDAELHHSYGPTETSIAATEWTCEPDANAISMGRALGNVRVYVLDRAMQPVPRGAAGELFIGGAGVGLGYSGRPDLTAERFVPDPFSGSGARLYRTGDLVRQSADGLLAFLGRLDDQVKVRGYRIELGEIERALEEHPAVAQAAAKVWQEGLVAYVVPREPIESIALRDVLRARLPEYMLPYAIVPLERIPIAANGKVDRKALPAPERVARAAYQAPRNDVESALAQIWAELFAVERVGIEDDFFDLGGHSLLATRLLARINDTFSVDLPLRRVFEVRTIAGLAEAVGEARNAGAAPSIGRLARRAVTIPVARDRPQA